jgi:signal recognition particle subunit SRP54
LFENLGNKLTAVFDRLKKRGALSVADVEAALREVRVALLEADVALPVVKDFLTKVQEKAVGVAVLQSINPSQMVIKIVSDQLKDMLGGENAGLNLNTTPPAVILMVGLQSSGKTTTSGKLAKRLADKQRKKVLLASLDIYRPLRSDA